MPVFTEKQIGRVTHCTNLDIAIYHLKFAFDYDLRTQDVERPVSVPVKHAATIVAVECVLAVVF